MIAATCVIGWVNCRAYTMNACTSPSDMVPLATRQTTHHADRHVVQGSRMNIIAGWMIPRCYLSLEARAVEILVQSPSKVSPARSLLPEHLHDACGP